MQSTCFSSIFLSSLLICLFTSINLQTSFCVEDLWYSNCSQTFKCGSIENVSYPFWGVNRADYCGQPGFKLDCQDDVPKIMMLQNTFRVLGINPEQQILKVARDDYWKDICPAEFINTTIDSTHFSYVSSGLQNLTIYYDCYLGSNTYYLPPSLNCIINTTTINVLYATITSSYDPFLGECISNVQIPINETAAQTLYENPMMVNDTLKAGFDLQWKIGGDQCNRCLNSGGVCGYNRTTTQFTCFCQDQPWPSTCPPRPGLSLSFLATLHSFLVLVSTL
ncbi:hypothetical protein SLE2022_275470 [Rubroshorea leprosula]